MNVFLIALLTTSLGMSAVILFLFGLNRALEAKLPSDLRYYLWVVVLLGLLVPVRPDLPLSLPLASVPDPLTAAVSLIETRSESLATQAYSAPIPAGSAAATVPVVQTAQSVRLPWGSVLFGVWLLGVLGVLAVRLRAHLRFVATARRWGTDPQDGRLREILATAQADLGLRDRQIAVKTCSLAASPILVGFFRPTILLPVKTLSAAELDHVFRHELTHYKRRDLWINLLVLLVSAMHWFNPLVRLMAGAIRADCEASCDALAVAGRDVGRRKEYGQTILSFIGVKSGGEPVLSTYFYEGEGNMKKRLLAIMDSGRKSKFLAAFCALSVLSLTMLAGSGLAGQNSGQLAGQLAGQIGIQIDEAQARAIALTHAGISEQEAEFLRVRTDREHGRTVYELKFLGGSAEYDYEVDALSGAILEFSRDLDYYALPTPQPGAGIGEAEARATALAAAGLSEAQIRNLRINQDRERGLSIWEVEFRSGNVEYEYEIDAATGTVITADVESNY